jgi:hypothetical protein
MIQVDGYIFIIGGVDFTPQEKFNDNYIIKPFFTQDKSSQFDTNLRLEVNVIA